MAKQTIDIGSSANDGTGDPFRTVCIKTNSNIDELYDGAVFSADTDASGFSFVIDEDDMTSDSATKVPTQQSVKAYVDANSGGTVDVVSNVAADTILGRVTAGSGDSEELTATQVRTLLNVEDGADVTDATNVDAAGATMNTDTDVSGNSWVLDEDDFASDSATKVPTQQSVKAYVDANGGGASKASTAEILDGTDNKYVSPAGIDAALAFVTLTDAASVAWDMNTGRNFKVTLGGNRTMAEPSNITEGRSGVLRLTQDGTGSRAVTWDAAFEFVGGTAPTLSTTAGETDTFSYFCPDSSTVQIAHIGVFS